MKKLILPLFFVFSTLSGQHDDISLSVSEIDVDLFIGESDTVEVVITNSGDSDVDWSVEINDSTEVYGGVTFTKIDYADWTDETNQDRVSDNLWITRCDQYALFNAYYQSCAYNNGPEGTQWAIGSLYDGVENLNFGDFIEVLNYNVGDVLNENLIPNNLPMVMHDTNEDVYYEVQFHSWTSGGNGGGFSYTRIREGAGTLSANSSDTLTVILGGPSLDPGEYSAEMIISTSDTNTPELLVDIDLTVIGSSILVLSTDSLDFDTLSIGLESSQFVELLNTGNDLLTITSVSSDNSEFQVSLDDDSLDIMEST